jgi:hypothetical protein
VRAALAAVADNRDTKVLQVGEGSVLVAHGVVLEIGMWERRKPRCF